MTNFVAAEGGTQNFLVPNGTFFVEIVIFAVVLGVIWKFVVPPIRQVLDERDALVAKTAEDNHKAIQAAADAETSYQAELAKARSDASAIRDEARADGQKELESARGVARKDAASAASEAAADLARTSESVGAGLRSEVGPLSETLASRVLGVDIDTVAADKVKS